MSHRSFPITIILAALLLVALPSQSFATPMGSDAAATSKSGSKNKAKDDDKLQEILKEIFTLGGLFDFGGSKGGSRDPGKSSADADTDEIPNLDPWVGDMAGEIFRLPIIYPEGPKPPEPDLAAPIPEPSGALLFGMGILAVASRRTRSARRR